LKQAVLVVDVQPCFNPPDWLISRSQRLANSFPSIATVERHDEEKVPFFKQLGWKPASDDESLVKTDHMVVKHGYRPTDEVIKLFQEWAVDRVLVCGVQADTCVLAAGFMLFDSGLQPTIVADAVVGSELDRSGRLGVNLWKHHFGHVVEKHTDLF